MTDEQRDLDNLLKHPGWLLITEHGQSEVDGRVQTAMRNAAGERDDVQALNLLRQCIAAKDALEAFIAWPASRLKVLQQAAANTVTSGQLSRRGDL